MDSHSSKKLAFHESLEAIHEESALHKPIARVETPGNMWLDQDTLIFDTCEKAKTLEEESKSLATALETKNTVLGLIQNVESTVTELDARLVKTVKKTPDRVNSRTLSRSISGGSHNSASKLIGRNKAAGLLFEDHQKQLEDIKFRVKSILENVEELLQEDTRAAVSCLKEHYVPKLHEVLEQIKESNLVVGREKPDSSVPSARPPAVMRSVSTGAESISSTCSGSKGYVCAITNGLSKEGLVDAVPGKEVKLRLFLWGREVRSNPIYLDNLSCTVVPAKDTTESSTLCSVKLRQLRTDTFEASFTIFQEGSYRFVVALSSIAVSGSPFAVVVKNSLIREEVVRESLFSPCSSSLGGKTGRPASQKSGSDHQRRTSNRLSEVDEDDFLVTTIGSFGRESGQFLNPQGICLTDDDCIAVTDSNIGCIQVFSVGGKFLKKIGTRGRRPGQIFRPTGIAFLPKHLSQHGSAGFVVCDYENRTVVLYNTDGQLVSSFGAAKLTGPKGVAVAQNGDIIVVDNRANCLFVFRGGKTYKKIWSPSSTEAHLAGPHYVAVSQLNGDIFVSDFHHHTIKVFDAQYKYRCSFGSFSVEAAMGSFSGPTGLAVDRRGVVVSDWGSGRIQILDHQGSFLAYVTTASNPLYGPQGLALAEDGTIYACDSGLPPDSKTFLSRYHEESEEFRMIGKDFLPTCRFYTYLAHIRFPKMAVP